MGWDRESTGTGSGGLILAGDSDPIIDSESTPGAAPASIDDTIIHADKIYAAELRTLDHTGTPTSIIWANSDQLGATPIAVVDLENVAGIEIHGLDLITGEADEICDITGNVDTSGNPILEFDNGVILKPGGVNGPIVNLPGVVNVLHPGVDSTPGSAYLNAAVRAVDNANIISSFATPNNAPATPADGVIQIGAYFGPSAGAGPHFYAGTPAAYTDIMYLPDRVSSYVYMGQLWGGLDGNELVQARSAAAGWIRLDTARHEKINCQLQGDVYLGGGFGQINGGLKRVAVYASALVTATPTFTINFTIPTGSRLLGVQLNVENVLDAGDLWDAEWNDGATLQSIATAQAVAANTKVNSMYTAIQTVTDADTNVIITKNGGGSFTLQGRIGAVAYYEDFETLSNA
jgi:hypothetical protein